MTGLFDRNLEAINLKAEEIVKRQREITRNEKVGSEFYSTAEKMSQKFFSQTNSLALKTNNIEFSSGKKVSLGGDEFSFNYDIIEEAVNEVTSGTQFFGFSESHMNPPTHSYGNFFGLIRILTLFIEEMSMNQYFNMKNAEESKKNESRKSFELAKDTRALYE